MKLKNMMRIGYILIFAGVLITSLLLLQAKDCPTFECSALYVYLAGTALFITVLLFMLAAVFTMGLLIKRKKDMLTEKMPVNRVKIRKNIAKTKKRKHFK
jgi:hypothetical protein